MIAHGEEVPGGFRPHTIDGSMTKLPVVRGRECITALQRGFVIDRQKGSHNPNT